MEIGTAEISRIIKEQIRDYEKTVEVQEIGTVLSTGDGIARIYGLDRVAAGKKDNRNRGGRRLSRQCRRKSVDGGNHGYLTMNQIGHEFRQPIVLTLCPSIFYRDIPALDVAGFRQALVEGGD